MHALMKLPLGILLLIAGANAQFQFFEQMFQGQQQHQQQAPQNVPSDSSWYQQNYDNGMLPFSLSYLKILT
jgi:hypothetical protein